MIYYTVIRGFLLDLLGKLYIMDAPTTVAAPKTNLYDIKTSRKIKEDTTHDNIMDKEVAKDFTTLSALLTIIATICIVYVKWLLN